MCECTCDMPAMCVLHSNIWFMLLQIRKLINYIEIIMIHVLDNIYLCYVIIVRHFSSGFCGNGTSSSDDPYLCGKLNDLCVDSIKSTCPLTLYI